MEVSELMNVLGIRWIKRLSAAALFALISQSVIAQPQPVGSPNGSFSGTVDGHSFELPVHCMQGAGFLDISSHDRSISNSATIGGVEPAMNISAFETGYQVVVFVGGQRYKFLQATDAIDVFPFTLSREVRASKIGNINVDFTVDCPLS